MSSPDVVVVGGGAVGLACALELARAGASVRVLERDRELAAGCSAGNAGLVCPSHAAPLATRTSLLLGLRSLVSRDTPLALGPRPALVPWLLRFAAAARPSRERAATDAIRALALLSHELHAGLNTELGTGLEPRGTLNIFETEVGLETGLHEAEGHRAAGIRSERLSPEEALALEPALGGSIAGAIHYPGELNGDPAAFVRALAAAASEAGVVVSPGTEALSLKVAGGRVAAVEARGEQVEAGEVVVAAGAWTPRLVAPLGIGVPVEAGKGFHLDYEAATGDPRMPVFVYESRAVATSLPGRLRLTGALALVGLDLSLDERRLAAIERVSARHLSGFVGRRPIETWSGLRPCSPDGLPIIGRPAGLENLVLATGHGMLGFTLAPVTGRLVAQLVKGAAPELDPAPYEPDRFRDVFLSRVS